MPSILKRFMKPAASLYQFPNAEDLVVDEDPPAQEESDVPGEEHAPEPHRAPSHTPKSAVDYAKIQADAILADAQQAAEEMLDRAKADAQEELDRLREQARQDGYQIGYSEGMAGAMTEARVQREAQAAQLSEAVNSFLSKAVLARDEMMDQAQDELRDLAVAVAEKVVRVSLKSSKDVIARMIQGATEKLKRKEWVHIYIAGCDAKGMVQSTPTLTMALSALSDHVKIVPMADDESGTCIIEMPDEIIDASASTQLSNIRDILLEGRIEER